MGGPELWIIGGPNGAGKSTLCSAGSFWGKLQSIHICNPDHETLQLLRKLGYPAFAGVPADVLMKANIQAVEETLRKVESGLETGEFVAVETVLSTDKYRPLVQRARELGGRFYFIYVSLASPELSLERIHRRVRRGGHDVPPDKVAGRWRRSLGQFPWFAGHADDFWVFDNSDSGRGAPLLLAHGWKTDTGVSQMEMFHPDFNSPMMTVLRELALQFRGRQETDS